MKREDPEKFCKLKRESRQRYKKKYPEKIRAYKRKYKHEHPEQNRKQTKRAAERRRYEILCHYSKSNPPVCANCGENHIEFLEIDHINGGGRQHKREIGGNLFAWLRKNNLPEGFQVLCANCNAKKAKEQARANCGNGTPTQKSHYTKYQRLRERIFNHYAGPTGIKCSCCGRDDIDVLCLNRSNAEVSDYYKALGKSMANKFYKIVVRDGFPDGFRILCSNCNQSLGHHGYCPHEKYSDYNTIQPSLRIMQI